MHNPTSSPAGIINQAASTLLFKPKEYGELYKAVHQLHDVFAALADVVAGNIDDEHILLSSGVAVSPITAAHCLLDFQRTAVFLRGVYKAILQLKATFPNERLNILYAGCGPYATLLTPLTSFFSADELAFYMLDINPVSLEAAQKLYQSLGLENYVEEWLLQDATTYQFPSDRTLHLVISETMLNALRKEPQVSIMANLVPQLPENGLCVPEEITVSVQLQHLGQETAWLQNPGFQPQRVTLGIVGRTGRYAHHLPEPVSFPIPDQTGQPNDLVLTTDITTFGDEKLTAYNCGLNLPFYLQKISGYQGRVIRFHYDAGESCGFKYQII